jgi:hypothetical protein
VDQQAARIGGDARAAEVEAGSPTVTDSNGDAEPEPLPNLALLTELRNAAAGLAQSGNIGVCCGARSSLLLRRVFTSRCLFSRTLGRRRCLPVICGPL